VDTSSISRRLTPALRRLSDTWGPLRDASAEPPALSRWSRAADAVLALVVTVGTLDSALTRSSSRTEELSTQFTPTTPDGLPSAPGAPLGSVIHHFGPVHAWQLALAVLAGLPLVARRRYPLAVLATVVTASTLFHLSPGFDALATFIACVIAAYSAAAYSPHRTPALGGALAATSLLVIAHKSSVPVLQSGTASLLFLLPVGLVIGAAGNWSQRIRALEREKEAASRQAAEQERARIARELHDVITHHVSVMVVQAGAARKIMDLDPTEAKSTLLAVEASGRTAMTELRHAMDLLTMDAEDGLPGDDLRPAAGLRQLPALAERLRQAGVTVELTVGGDPVQLPPGMDLAAYRVVQEAVTNTMKHAEGAEVLISVGHTPEAVAIEVTDTGGTAAPTARSGGGRGLTGLRERLGVYGGSLTAGPTPDGGFRVRAEIPRVQDGV
jgi:signal transduction histidine kinase